MAVLQSGATSALNLSVRRIFGVDGHFRVKLLRLEVVSRGGSGLYKGIHVSWKRASFQWPGKLNVQEFDVGRSSAPFARVEGLRYMGTGEDGRLTVARCSLYPARWKEIGAFKSGRRRKPPSPPDLAPLLKRTILIETLDIELPGSRMKGQLLLLSSSGNHGAPFRIDLHETVGQGSQLRSFLAEGKIRAQDAWCDVRMEGRAGRARGHFQWKGSGWVLEGQADFEAGSQWAITGWGRLPGVQSILLQNLKQGRRAGGIITEVHVDEYGAVKRAAAETMGGGLSLPFIVKKSGWQLSDTEVSLRYGVQAPNGGYENQCGNVNISGNLHKIEAGSRSSDTVNVNLELQEKGDFLATINVASRRSGAVQNLVDGLAQGRVENGSFTFSGMVESRFLSGFAAGRIAERSGKVRVKAGGMGGRLSAVCSWDSEQWRLKGTGRWKRKGSGTIPLPEGTWNLAFQASGKGGRPEKAVLNFGELRGQGLVQISLKDGAVHGRWQIPRIEGGGLWASDFAGTWDMELPDGTWTVARASGRLTLREARFGQVVVGDISAPFQCSNGRLRSKVSFQVPHYDGSGGFSLNTLLSNLKGVALHDAFLNLSRPAVKISGLSLMAVNSARGGFSMQASKASVEGITAGDLTGWIGKSEGSELAARLAGYSCGGSFDADLAQRGPDWRVLMGGKGIDLQEALSAVPAGDRPLGVKAGKGSFQLSLKVDGGSVSGKGTAELEDATFELPDDRHLVRTCSGKFSMAWDKGVFEAKSQGLTFEKGSVSARVELAGDARGGRLNFSIPDEKASAVQYAFFDFLPEYFGYGKLGGRAALSGVMTWGDRGDSLSLEADFREASFVSEDGALDIQGLNGAVPLVLRLKGQAEGVQGFSAPKSAEEFDRIFKNLNGVASGKVLSARRILFSVYDLEKPVCSVHTAHGTTVLVLKGGALFDGETRGRLRLSASTGGMQYSGQILVHHASLRKFCSESGNLTGFLSGAADASVTFSGDRVGLAGLKALARIAVDPLGGEPMVIGRDFLVKVGGQKMRTLFPSRLINYDKAALICGIDNGSLTIYDLELYHRANPLKALLRKDISFNLKIPPNSSISIFQLLDDIKALQSKAARVEQKISPAGSP